tara:strand:+ start:75 stop:581 length:507 start_codon:yes stop_codon:yes gene_type:complete
MYETDTPNSTTLALARGMLSYNGSNVQVDPAIQQTNRIFQEEVIDPDNPATADQANAPGMDEQVSPMSAAIMGAIVSALTGLPNVMSLAQMFSQEEEPEPMGPVDPLTDEIDEINLTEAEMGSTAGHFSEAVALSAPAIGAEGEISDPPDEDPDDVAGVGGEEGDEPI